MSIQQFFRILWARRLIVAITLAAALVAALMTLKLVPKSYEATSRVILEIVKPDPVTGEVVSSGFARAYTSTQLELIKDYRVAGRAVDALGWAGSTELAQQYEASGSDVPFHRWLADLIITRTEVRVISGSNIVEIAYSGTNPEVAATIADALRAAYVEQTLQFKRQTAARNAEWFTKQSEELKRRLTEAEARKAKFERENDIVLQDDAMDTDSARLQALAGASSAPMMGAMGYSPSQAQLAQVDAAIAMASRTLGPNHPDLVSMKQQRAVIAAQAGRETTGGGGGPNPVAMFNAQKSRVLAQRGKLAEAKALQNDVNILRDQLKFNTGRAAQLQQEALSQDAGLTLLGSASPPQSPSFPKTLPVLFGSLALGFGVGILLSLLVELLNRRIRGVDDLALFNVPVLGALSVRPIEKRRFGFLPALPGPQ